MDTGVYSTLYDWGNTSGQPYTVLTALFNKIKANGSEQSFKIEYKISHKYSTYESTKEQEFNCKWTSDDGIVK